MRLVEILARELVEWQDGVVAIAQDDNRSAHPHSSADIVYIDGEWLGNHNDCVMLAYYDVMFSRLASDHTTAIVTREQWQAEKDKTMSKEWDGNGKPPVGTVCEVNNGGDTEYFLYEVVAYHHRSGRPILESRRTSRRTHTHAPECWKFRPILTARDRWIESASEYGCLVTIEHLYDALASGELDAPERGDGND